MGLTLTLVRGLPGSGKSTMAKALAEQSGAMHLEADMYFIDIIGDYKYEADAVKHANEWCQNQTRQCLISRRDVVVSNAFIKKWEMQVYFAMAADNGADAKVVVAKGNYGNIHGVPEDVVARMRANWEV